MGSVHMYLGICNIGLGLSCVLTVPGIPVTARCLSHGFLAFSTVGSTSSDRKAGSLGSVVCLLLDYKFHEGQDYLCLVCCHVIKL